MRFALLLVLAGCTVGGAAPTSDAGPEPELDTAAIFEISLQSCFEHRYARSLGLGSAYAEVQPSGNVCLILLGGETENPGYDGAPTQRCMYPRVGTAEILASGQGGPARSTSPYCVGL